MVETSIRLWKISDWTMLRGQAPQKQKKTAHRVRAGDIGALATLGSFACTGQKKNDAVNLDELASYEGTTWGERPSGGCSGSGQRVISENRATEKEGETDNRSHKHSPQKRRNGSMPVGYSNSLKEGAM
jgi:hypothetical protein